MALKTRSVNSNATGCGGDGGDGGEDDEGDEGDEEGGEDDPCCSCSGRGEDDPSERHPASNNISMARKAAAATASSSSEVHNATMAFQIATTRSHVC